MGKSIILDPIDLFHLKQGTNKDFAQLLDREIELNVVDGMILPNLKMDEDTDACPFLDERKGDARSMHFERESAVCFPWEDYMRKMDSDIFF